MVFWIAAGAGLVAAYLLGAIPFGYLAARWLKGVDIRREGSGGTGATNVLRTLGPGPALAVLALDLLKGLAAVVFAGWVCTLSSGPQAWIPWIASLAGLLALVGHSRSVWLGFTGGKSAATGLGVLLALSWPVGAGAFAVFALVVAVSRIVSLGSMLAAVTAGVMILALPHPLPYRLLVVAGGLYVIVRHRANIGRLLAGTEPRVGQPGPKAP